jgi:pSer/pThr/pTyr-binding forkhead associated (FHA) protein
MAGSDEKKIEHTRRMPRRDKAAAKSPVQKAYLVLLTGAKAGTHYAVPDDRMTIIGRGEECQIRTDDRDASRKHAALQPFGTEFYIMDMGSTNGTLINGKPEEKRILRHADKITVGQQVFQFLLTGPDGSPLLIHPNG